VLSLTIITGPPGAGKTTLAARLAAAETRGAHVVGDTFYTFLANPIHPARPDAHEQNIAVIVATVRASGALADAGYEVFLDGIFGPWFLPLVTKELETSRAEVRYVVLRVGLDEALRRTALRATPLEETVIRQMHAAFAQLGDFERHALDVSNKTIDDLAAEFARVRNRFALARGGLGITHETYPRAR
jgi:predicted kinase